MPLMQKYHTSSAPSYLMEEGFKMLRSEPERLDAIKIHTDMVVNVLNNEIEDGELTKVILMDHLDWFSLEDATAEISAVFRKMAKGGKVFWRSAGKHPWYISLLKNSDLWSNRVKFVKVNVCISTESICMLHFGWEKKFNEICF